MKARIADALRNLEELDDELSSALLSASNSFEEIGDCESAVDEALDITEKIHEQLLIIHGLYRMGDQWTGGESWR